MVNYEIDNIHEILIDSIEFVTEKPIDLVKTFYEQNQKRLFIDFLSYYQLDADEIENKILTVPRDDFFNFLTDFCRRLNFI